MALTKKRCSFLLALVAVGFLWGGWRLWEIRRQRQAFAEIETAMRVGRNGLASQKLKALLAAQPGLDRAAYLLGVCEQARGDAKAALDAWEQVSLDSSFAGLAIRSRMDLLMQRGRLADAESLIIRSLDDPRLDRFAMSTLLLLVYTQQGRFEEATRFMEETWNRLNQSNEGGSENAINLARMHIELQGTPPLSDAVRNYFEQAGKLESQDDRIWLGKANDALRSGAFDKAAGWLTACLLRRPDDWSVWRTKLKLAMATGRLPEVREALAHLPAERSSRVDARRVAAWLFARRGDAEAETRTLERIITDDPADSHAIDRLIERLDQRASAQRIAELRRQKNAFERLKARYRVLFERFQPARDAAEMGQLAEKLGRWFEAKVFLTAAIDEEPDRADLLATLARVKARVETIDRSEGRTLADVLSSALGADAPTGQQKSPVAGRSGDRL